MSDERKHRPIAGSVPRVRRNDAPRVLLVDDDRDIHAQVSSMLDGARCRLHSCTNSEQALKLCRARRFDLLLVSFLFEVTTARDLLAELHRRLPHERIPPILILNGLGEVLGFDTFRDYPRVKAMVAKPLNAKTFLSAVRRMLPVGQHEAIGAG